MHKYFYLIYLQDHLQKQAKGQIWYTGYSWQTSDTDDDRNLAFMWEFATQLQIWEEMCRLYIL